MVKQLARAQTIATQYFMAKLCIISNKEIINNYICELHNKYIGTKM